MSKAKEFLQSSALYRIMQHNVLFALLYPDPLRIISLVQPVNDTQHCFSHEDHITSMFATQFWYNAQFNIHNWAATFI